MRTLKLACAPQAAHASLGIGKVHVLCWQWVAAGSRGCNPDTAIMQCLQTLKKKLRPGALAYDPCLQAPRSKLIRFSSSAAGVFGVAHLTFF
jgi:hypothetical protein